MRDKNKVLTVEGIRLTRETSRKRVFNQNGSTSVACLSYTLRNEGNTPVIIDNDITLCQGAVMGFSSDAVPTYRDDKITFRFDTTGILVPFKKLVVVETVLDHPEFLTLQNA